MTTATKTPATETATAPACEVAWLNRVELLAALRLIAKVAPRRSPKPALQCVRLTFADGRATLYATDLEQSASFTLSEVDISNGGELLANAADLLTIVRNSSAEVLQLVTRGSMLEVIGDAGSESLPLWQDTALPDAPAAEPAGWFDIDAAALLAALKYTTPATDCESSRYALGGVLLEVSADGETLSVVGTDGRRLHNVPSPLAAPCDNPAAFPVAAYRSAMPVLLPLAAAKTLIAALAKREGVATVSAFPGFGQHVRIACEGVDVVARCLEGRYPAYRDAIPDRSTTEHPAATVDAAELVKACRTARRWAAAAGWEDRGVTLRIQSGAVELSKAGGGSVSVPATDSTGDIRVSLDPAYLLDAANNLPKGAAVTIETDNGHKMLNDGWSDGAVVLTVDNGPLAVVMPLAIDR